VPSPDVNRPQPFNLCQYGTSILVLDKSVRAVSASGGFGVPVAFVILIFDRFGVPRYFLLLRGRLCRGEGLGMRREAFRKRAIDFIGLATVMLDNLIGDIGHGMFFGFADN